MLAPYQLFHGHEEVSTRRRTALDLLHNFDFYEVIVLSIIIAVVAEGKGRFEVRI